MARASCCSLSAGRAVRVVRRTVAHTRHPKTGLSLAPGRCCIIDTYGNILFSAAAYVAFLELKYILV